MKNDKLFNYLHDLFLSRGEITKWESVASDIADFEFDAGLELPAETLLASYREAGDAFVDSMIENASGHYSHEKTSNSMFKRYANEDEFNAYVASLEAMRPRNVRVAAIRKINATK